jgi:urea transporter
MASPLSATATVQKGFWNGSTGRVLRWIALPFAAVLGLQLALLIGVLNGYMVDVALPYLPADWRSVLSGVLVFYFGPLLWVLLPARVAPRGRRVVVIVFAAILGTSMTAGVLLAHMRIASPAYSGAEEVLWAVLGIAGIATGLGYGLAFAEDHAQAS